MSIETLKTGLERYTEKVKTRVAVFKKSNKKMFQKKSTTVEIVLPCGYDFPILGHL
jgi:hypothetical protein